jgi:fumarate reductase flavoprotein subunit
LTNSRLTPHPAPGAVIAAGIVVDGRGRRFVDESCTTNRVSSEIAHSSSPGDCWLIFDDAIWNGAAKQTPIGGGALLPVNPTVIEEGGTLIEADSLEALVEAIPSPMEDLVRTVTEYNDALADGRSGDMDVPRTGDPVPLLRAPFRAMPLIAGVYFTMGGPLVNGRAEVIDEGGEVIRGLYAAGGTMGGLMGGPRAGYAGGWAEASTFGLLAAENAMATLGARTATA